MVWGIPVGNGSVQIWHDSTWEGRPAWRILATGQTTGIISLFYRVNDSMESLCDPKTMLPYVFRVHFEEGKYRRIQEYRFDQDQLRIRGLHGSELAMEQPTYDPLSAILYLRSAALMEGTVLKGSVSDGRKIYRMQADVKVDKKNVAGRETPIWVLEPKMESVELGGILAKQKFRRIVAWFTQDSDRVPILVKGDLFFGALVAKLDERSVRPSSNSEDKPSRVR